MVAGKKEFDACSVFYVPNAALLSYQQIIRTRPLMKEDSGSAQMFQDLVNYRALNCGRDF